MRNFLLGLFVGALICGLIAFVGGSKYVEGIEQGYIDSIQGQRALNALKIDSLNLVLDSLEHDSVRIETEIIYLKQNEEKHLVSIDSLPDSNLIRSIREYLNY